jgi:hypothetical protein
MPRFVCPRSFYVGTAHQGDRHPQGNGSKYDRVDAYAVERIYKAGDYCFYTCRCGGWFVVDNWLDAFAYRVDVHPVIFVGSGAIATVIAWLTVRAQSIKAAASDPVKSLRYE